MVDKDDNVFFSFINNEKLYKLNAKGVLEVVYQINDKDLTLIIEAKGDQLLSAQTKYRKNASLIQIRNSASKFNIKVNTLSSKDFSYGFFTTDLTKEKLILYAQNEKLTIINPDKTYKTLQLSSRIIWVSEADDGFLWIGHEFSGVKKYNINKIESGPEEAFLVGKSISSVCIDKDGGEWFTTLESGLYYRPIKAITNYTEEDGLSGNNITTTEVYNGKLYIGTGNGFLNVLENGLMYEKMNFQKKVSSIKSYQQKKLFVSTDAFLYYLENGKFTRFLNNHKLLLDPKLITRYNFSIKDFLPVNEKEIFLGQMQSFTIINDGNVTYDSYLDDSIAFRIESIAKLSDSTFLLGTFSGLWKYSNNKFSYLGEKNRLLKQRITDILVIDKPNYKVLGTKGSGIIIMSGDSLYQITHEKGLTSNSITSLLLVDNELWIGTNNGLNVIKIVELKSPRPYIKIFKKEHGLVSDEINEIKSVNNKIYISANGGLTVFDRSLYKPSVSPPPVYIEKISVNDKLIKLANKIFLKYDENFIRIYFSGIDFRDAGNLKYKYRLYGINNYWSITLNSQVDYSFLPPGNYRFEVMAINSEWQNNEPVFINIVIGYPFWQTWWFLMIIFLLSILFIFLVVKYSAQRIRKRHQLQNDIYKYRQEALIKQMDPHFVFNTLNSIQSFIMRNDSVASSQYLTKFSRLMRLILNNSQKQAITLREEIESLNLYMEIESMRFTRKFSYSIAVETGIDTDLILIPAFIIQPFIENSIWHGIMGLEKEGNIYVEFHKHEDYLVVLIEDNGIGRKQAEAGKQTQISEKKSIGLSIVESRLALLCKTANIPKKLEFIDLTDEKNEPMGTRVLLNLPIVNSVVN
ncbi:MAG TPA: histidine kinase [Lentimicrobium sp.]|nr:histidine kinase [Lentimicrobium sp.]